MADVIVIESAPTPASAPSAPSAQSPATPTDAVIEVIHDDARDLGYALARLAEHDNAINELRADVAVLATNANAQQSVTADIVEAVEDIATEVENIEPGEQIAADPEPDPEDTAPGKTHWFKRPAHEWAGKR